MFTGLRPHQESILRLIIIESDVHQKAERSRELSWGDLKHHHLQLTLELVLRTVACMQAERVGALFVRLVSWALVSVWHTSSSEEPNCCQGWTGCLPFPGRAG